MHAVADPVRAKGRGISPALAALATLATGWAMPLVAQHAAQPVSAYAQARTSVSEALALQDEGEFDGAHAMLLHELGECGRGTDDALDCLYLVYFSLGFLLQREAGRAPDPEALLRQAVEYYERVGTIDRGVLPPGTPAERLTANAVYNVSMLYRSMAPREWHEPHYRSAPEHDPERAGLHLTLLGDYYAATGRVEEAVDAYRRGARVDPDDEAPRAALLELYRGMGEGAAGHLFELGEAWEDRFPHLAARAYETVAAAHGADPELAGGALVRWVWVLARGGGLDAGAVGGLPGDWAPVRDLEGFFEDPEDPWVARWWLATEERSRALARAALSLGRRSVTEGRPDHAERIWSAARELVDVATAEALDLKRELALLYFGHPDLDPEGARFDRLERDLFEEKGLVLAARDLEAAQRYHSLLGQIYAHRGVWRSEARGWNAVDQLTWALETAERRDAAEGFLQPLPELRALLAEGYDAVGDTRAAYAQHEHAARAHLDVDDLSAAAASLARAVPPGRVSAMSALIDYRGRLAEVGAGTPEGAALCAPELIERAVSGSARVWPEFAKRQRFKLLSDCVEITSRRIRATYGAEAIHLVVEDDLHLVGIADVHRLERAAAAVSERVDFRDGGLHVDYEPHEQEGALELRVALPSATRPAYVSVSADAVIASRIVRLVGPDPDPYGARILVRDGEVLVERLRPGPEHAEWAHDLAELEGVRRVRTVRRPM